MSTVKAKLRCSSNAAGAGRVVYMINHQQEVGRIPSSIALRESEWDDKEGIAKKALGSDGRTIACANKRIAKDIAAIKGIIGDLEAAPTRRKSKCGTDSNESVPHFIGKEWISG